LLKKGKERREGPGNIYPVSSLPLSSNKGFRIFIYKSPSNIILVASNEIKKIVVERTPMKYVRREILE
jgi:hypothetical protein